LLCTLQTRSVAAVEELTLRQARELLSEWASVTASRDDRVRTAYVSGVSKSEISRLTGIARTTISRILGEADDIGADGSQTKHDLGRAQ